ncbi:hypothetical protein ACRS5L_22105 [Metapseudomonas otitidis]|uniref:hypothetical protein n=1 Tax=Metapseudomonas otitidis TaxID=319939 RepID=UPI003EDF5ED2
MKNWIYLFFTLLTGCCPFAENTKTLEELAHLQTSSSYHPLFYIGSDIKFHYFKYLNGKYWVDYKSPRKNTAPLSFEYEKNTNEAKVLLPGTIELEL